MLVKLFKVPFYYKDKKGVERKGYNLYVVNESGNAERIRHNSYTGANGNHYDNESLLLSWAIEIDDIKNVRF